MKLLDHHGTELRLEGSPSLDTGDHAIYLYVKDEEGEVAVILDPLAAVGLASALRTWAEDRVRKEGI
jgi:hypothetical protein